MQKLHLTLFILSISFLLFSNCKKECDCKNQGRLEFEGNTLALDKAILENWGEHERDEAYEGNRQVVGVFSPEVTIHYSDSDVDSMSGLGHGILFELFADEPNNFNSSGFTFSAEYTTGTFSFGLVYHDFLFEHDDWLEEEFINSGNLTLTANDGELTLEFTGCFESGELVTAYYYGEYIFLEINE
jgi:hypothetical protein